MMSADRKWTPAEDALLRQLVQQGKPPKEVIAELSTRFSRSPEDVRIRGLSLHQILEAERARDQGLPPPRVRVKLFQEHAQEFLAKHASAQGVSTLYRYRPLRNEKELDWAIGEALRGRFYFPTRAQLRANDDSDLRLKFVMPDKEKARAIIRDQQQLRGVSPRDAAEENARWESASYMKRHLRWYNDVYASQLDRSFGTLCFTSGGGTNPKFWREYAAGHGGVCLHLDARTGPLSEAMLVEYSDEKHEIEITDISWPPFLNLMLHKRTKYQWEKEYRILYLPDMWDPLLADDDRYATIHPRCVIGITFGANVRPDYRTEFLLSLQPMAPAIFEESDFGRILRADLPPLYQAALDASGSVVTVKPFKFDYATREQIFDP
jgi:hypothetical protein